MTTLRLSAHSIAKGEPLTLTLGDHPALAGAAGVGFELYGVEDAATTLRFATGLNAAFAGGELVATLEATTSDMLQEGRIYEVAYLKPADAQGNELVSLLGGMDFPRTFFRVKADPSEPDLTVEEATAGAREIQSRREEMYAAPLGYAGVGGMREFRVMMFVERLLLTRELRVPGVQIFPLIVRGQPDRRTFGLGASDEEELINQVLRREGWTGSRGAMDTDWWRENSSKNRPVVLMRAPRVYATDHGQALRIAHARRDRLLRLLAYHRDYSGSPFATAVQARDPATGEYSEARVWPEAERYTGNMLGGFVSGEDQSLILADYRAMGADPFVGFVLHLYAEAQADKDLDFAYFRYWNLLEIVAAERVEKGSPATDFSGAVIPKRDGKPFNTDSARGRVHELVRRGMQARDLKEDYHQQARDLSLGLWDAVYVWYGFRNATAHHGGFNADDPNQQSQSWYTAAIEAVGNGAQPRGYEPDPYFDYLKAVARDVVEWELGTAREATA